MPISGALFEGPKEGDRRNCFLSEFDSPKSERLLGIPTYDYRALRLDGLAES
jgi:hypothetical protein